MNEFEDAQLEKVLKRDALLEAEQLTGKSYKDDKGTEALGVLMHLGLVQEKRLALQAAHDTHFSMDVADYLRVVDEEGFQLALREPFEAHPYGGGTKNETLFVFFHPEGVLLHFDTYGGDHVNGGQFHYNVEVAGDHGEAWGAFSSGGWGDKNIFYGYHDCREALRHHLRGLRRVGRFLNPWKFDPMTVWLTHYADKESLPDSKQSDGSYSRMADTKTLERAAKLPQNVQDCMTVSIEKMRQDLANPPSWW